MRSCCHCNCIFRRFSTKIRNPYKVLGVDENASQSDIKKAFYSMSKKYHPDVVGTNDAKAIHKFLELKDAYDILKDDTQRRYFQRRSSGFSYEGGFSQSQNSRGVDRTGQEIRQKGRETVYHARAGQFYDPSMQMEREEKDKRHFNFICFSFFSFVIGINVVYVWLSSDLRKRKKHSTLLSQD